MTFYMRDRIDRCGPPREGGGGRVLAGIQFSTSARPAFPQRRAVSLWTQHQIEAVNGRKGRTS